MGKIRICSGSDKRAVSRIDISMVRIPRVPGFEPGAAERVAQKLPLSYDVITNHCRLKVALYIEKLLTLF